VLIIIANAVVVVYYLERQLNHSSRSRSSSQCLGQRPQHRCRHDRYLLRLRDRLHERRHRLL